MLGDMFIFSFLRSGILKENYAGKFSSFIDHFPGELIVKHI